MGSTRNTTTHSATNAHVAPRTGRTPFCLELSSVVTSYGSITAEMQVILQQKCHSGISTLICVLLHFSALFLSFFVLFAPHPLPAKQQNKSDLVVFPFSSRRDVKTPAICQFDSKAAELRVLHFNYQRAGLGVI